MAREYYDETIALARRISSEGFPEEGSALVDAIKAGTTSGEVLMAIRFLLRRYSCNRSLSGEVLAEIVDLLDDLDRLFA